MRDLATLAFIRDRVLAEIRANPATEPLLGEQPPAETCKRGHTNWVQYARQRLCRTCEREQRRARRTP